MLKKLLEVHLFKFRPTGVDNYLQCVTPESHGDTVTNTQETCTICMSVMVSCTRFFLYRFLDYIWPSGILCGRPDGLELTTDRVL